MSRHTPGPWVVRHDDMVCSKEGRIIADCESTSYNMRPAPPIAEDKANAALIAAAPAMYEALQAIVQACASRTYKEVLHTAEGKKLFLAYEQSCKALAQAEGK